MTRDEFPKVLLKEAVSQFEGLIGRFGEHAVAAGEEVYIQPSVYLSFHLVQMRTAGWTDTDFDELAAVSGTSALFAYQHDNLMPKYANLHIGMDELIADATGFGYEWVNFEGVDGAWQLIQESVDSGRPVKGWHWENVLFAGYQEATETEGREVFAMADGPDTFAKWWTWQDFMAWAKLVEGWGCQVLGRHAERVQTKPTKEVALRLMKDLIEWSTSPPAIPREKYPQATFGLAGIGTYAEDVADVQGKPQEYFTETAWLGCHAVNPQWSVRNSTGVYLERLVSAKAFPEQTNERLLSAAEEYKSAYAAWREFYRQLGHVAPENAWNLEEHRRAGAAAVRKALGHEKVAIDVLEKALAIVG